MSNDLHVVMHVDTKPVFFSLSDGEPTCSSVFTSNPSGDLAGLRPVRFAPVPNAPPSRSLPGASHGWVVSVSCCPSSLISRSPGLTFCCVGSVTDAGFLRATGLHWTVRVTLHMKGRFVHRIGPLSVRHNVSGWCPAGGFSYGRVMQGKGRDVGRDG